MKIQQGVIYLSDYSSWKNLATQIGWVHCHDSYVVVDCVESGVCVGEFSDKSGGWLDSAYLDQYKENDSDIKTTSKK